MPRRTFVADVLSGAGFVDALAHWFYLVQIFQMLAMCQTLNHHPPYTELYGVDIIISSL